VIELLRRAQQRPVGGPARAACVACSTPEAVAETRAWAARLAADRTHLAALLEALPGVAVVPNPRASFLLVRTERAGIWRPLRERGFAVRPGEAFPGLDGHWFRVTVPDPATSDAFVRVLGQLLG
jgi:histidinol-phosphate aminotransferase